MIRHSHLLAMLVGGVAAAQQAIVVQNAASPFSSSMLAPGSLAKISLRFDSASPPAFPSLDLSKPITAKLRTAQGFDRDVRVLSAELPFSVLVLLPEDIASGSSALTLFFNGTQSAPAPVTIISASPGIYTRTNSTWLANAQVNWEGRTQPNGLTTPARPGAWITLWGTGLGNTAIGNVSATVGGMPAVVGYAGRAPGFVGLDQFNLYLTPGVAYPEGCYVPVEIKAGVRAEVVANRVEVSVTSNGEPCRHYLGLSIDEMRTLDAGGTIPLGELRISRGVTPSQDQPDRFELNELADLTMSSVGATDFSLRPRADFVAPNSCRAETTLTSGVFGAIRGVAPLDTGRPVMLEGPGRSVELVPPFPGSGRYETKRDTSPPASDPVQLPMPFFNVGTWTLGAPGGRDIAPFRIDFRMPPSLRLLNFAEVRVADRSQDFIIRWDPVSFDATDEVLLTFGRAQSTGGQPSTSVRTIYCRAAAAQGQITVDKSLLAPFVPHGPGESVLPNLSLISLAPETFGDLTLRTGGRARAVIVPMTGVLAPVRIQ